MEALGKFCAIVALLVIKDQFFVRMISLSFGTPGLSLVTNLGYWWCFQNIFNMLVMFITTCTISGLGDNGKKREGGLDAKFNTYKGGIAFLCLFANWKTSGRVI